MSVGIEASQLVKRYDTEDEMFNCLNKETSALRFHENYKRNTKTGLMFIECTFKDNTAVWGQLEY